MEPSNISVEIKGKGRESFIEDLYLAIKEALTHKPQVITLENVETLADLLTELVNRKKEEQEGGEQEG